MDSTDQRPTPDRHSTLRHRQTERRQTDKTGRSSVVICVYVCGWHRQMTGAHIRLQSPTYWYHTPTNVHAQMRPSVTSISQSHPAILRPLPSHDTPPSDQLHNVGHTRRPRRRPESRGRQHLGVRQGSQRAHHQPSPSSVPSPGWSWFLSISRMWACRWPSMVILRSSLRSVVGLLTRPSLLACVANSRCT